MKHKKLHANVTANVKGTTGRYGEGSVSHVYFSWTIMYVELMAIPVIITH